jgi:hypothetical protein
MSLTNIVSFSIWRQLCNFNFLKISTTSSRLQDKILYSHKPMHYNGTEIDTNIQYQYLHAHDKMMDVTQ